MNKLKKNMTLLGAILLAAWVFLTSTFAYADSYNSSSSSSYSGWNERGYSLGSGNASVMSKKRHLLSSRDEQNIERKINSVSPFERVDFLRQVLSRIDTLDTNIRNSSMNSLVKKYRLALLAEVRVLVQTRINELTGSGSMMDTTPPAISVLMINGINSTEAKLDIMSNEMGKGYFVVLPNSATAPSATQVRSWQDAASNNASLAGSGTIVSWTIQFALANLLPNTSYSLYFVATDLSGNMTATPIVVSFTTLAFPDTTPPVISALSTSGTTSSGTILTATLSENGTGYFVVLPSGSMAPSAVQVKAWQDAYGMTASIRWLMSTSSATAQSFPIMGLAPSTTYNIYLTAQDMNGNLQPTVSIINVTTFLQY